MSDNHVYIGSVSPVISTVDQRKLLNITKQLHGLLSYNEFNRIMTIYGEAVDRILKENGVKDNDS